jgi:hypothetical protein
LKAIGAERAIVSAAAMVLGGRSGLARAKNEAEQQNAVVGKMASLLKIR